VGGIFSKQTKEAGAGSNATAEAEEDGDLSSSDSDMDLDKKGSSKKHGAGGCKSCS